MDERFEVQRTIPDNHPRSSTSCAARSGHVAIDVAPGCCRAPSVSRQRGRRHLRDPHGPRVRRDLPMGKYDVTVTITAYEQDAFITWEVSGPGFPSIGHYYGYRLEPVEGGTLVTSIYDWSAVDEKWKPEGTWPIVPEFALKATLGILERTVAARSRTRRWESSVAADATPPPRNAAAAAFVHLAWRVQLRRDLQAQRRPLPLQSGARKRGWGALRLTTVGRKVRGGTQRYRRVPRGRPESRPADERLGRGPSRVVAESRGAPGCGCLPGGQGPVSSACYVVAGGRARPTVALVAVEPVLDAYAAQRSKPRRPLIIFELCEGPLDTRR